MIDVIDERWYEKRYAGSISEMWNIYILVIK